MCAAVEARKSDADVAQVYTSDGGVSISDVCSREELLLRKTRRETKSSTGRLRLNVLLYFYSVCIRAQQQCREF